MDVLHRKGGVIRPEVSPYGFIRIYFIEDDLLEMQYYHIKASAFLSNAFPSKDIVWRMFWVVAFYVFSSEFRLHQSWIGWANCSPRMSVYVTYFFGSV